MTTVRPWQVVVLVASVGAWVVAARLLSGTVVPHGLTLPTVDVDAVFGADRVARAERYERFLYANWLLEQVAIVVTLAVYARRGARFVRESAAGPVGTGILLGMVGLALAWLASLPFSVADLWWARRHGLASSGYLDVVLGGWLELAGAFVTVSLVLLVVMTLARKLGSWWWLPASLALTVVATVLVFVEPYVTPGLEPVHDPRVTSAYAGIERFQGVGHIPLRVERVSDDTTVANAFAFGLGPSRRVVVWDTLLDGRFGPGEVDVVLAHEVAHHSSEHIPKALGWFALFALPAAFVLMLATRRRGGMGRPAAVPLALLVVFAYQLVTLPAASLVSRRMEAEADWKALATTDDPRAARGLFRELAATSLADPSPPALAQLLFGTHPTPADRVGMAAAWAHRHESRAPTSQTSAGDTISPARIGAGAHAVDAICDHARDRKCRGRAG